MGNTLRLCCLTVGLVAWGSSVCAESIADRFQELFRIADEHNTSIVKRMPAWSTVGVWSLRSVVKGGEMTKKGIKKVFR